MTSRELVHRTMEFTNTGGRAPRQIWVLPWAGIHCPKELSDIRGSFQWDMAKSPAFLRTPLITRGDPYQIGEFVDEWNCRFTTIQAGVFGEPKQPPVQDEDWDDVSNIHIPAEELTVDVDEVNRYCAGSDQFIMAGCNPRPFERLQFVRGATEAYMDLMLRPPKMMEFLKRMHEHHCRQFELWGKTDVDALGFSDDWGSQNSLLISPAMWEELFMPMYRDYIDIAKAHGKKTMMHSDGNTLAILPKLIELGLDAINTQIFCIGVEKLAPFKGKLTFWGEIDRQYLIPSGTTAEIDAAVDSVYDTLWQDGGCIAQCEFGAMANPANIRRIYERWDERTAR